MSINKSYAVFGLGRYGRAVVSELLNNGVTVLAVDSNKSVVDELAGEIPICKCADITEQAVIKQLGISNVDVVVISMAKNFEASVMATMLCKEAGVEKVIVKCASEAHYKILKKIGADEVVVPEHDSGIRLAKNLLCSGFLDIADISDDISILEIDVKSEWIGKTLRELELRKKYNINVIALKENENINISFNPDIILSNNMKMIVVANQREINRIK